MTTQWNSLIDWDALSGLFVTATTMNQQLRDNTEFLYTRPFNYIDNPARTTTSTTFVQMTGSSVSLTSYGGNMLIVVNGKAYNSAGATRMTFDIAIDGTRQGDTTNGLVLIDAPAANYMDCIDMVWFTSTPPSAASHSYSVYWKTSAGTANGLVRVYVMEIR